MLKFNLETKFVVCINNQDYPASLGVRKIYRIIPNNRAAEHHLIRVITVLNYTLLASVTLALRSEKYYSDANGNNIIHL